LFNRILGVAIALFGISGCTTFQQQAAVHPVSVVEAKIDFCAKLKKEYGSDATGSSSYAALCNFDSPAEVTSYNLLINLMSIGDQVCTRELAILSANQRTVNAGLSTSATTLSSIATLVTGGIASDILSAGSTISSSARGHINSEVYRADNPSSIIRLIQANRRSLGLKILKDWKNLGAMKTRQDALRDANRYHHSCSLYNGLALITAAVDEKSTKIEKTNEKLESPAGIQESGTTVTGAIPP